MGRNSTDSLRRVGLGNESPPGPPSNKDNSNNMSGERPNIFFTQIIFLLHNKYNQYSKDEFKKAIVASMHLVESSPPHIPAYRSVLAPPAKCKLERHGQRGRRDKAEQRGRYPLRNMRAKTNNDVRACPLGGNGAGPHPQRTRNPPPHCVLQ